MVDVPLAAALDHDIPQLERLPNVLENGGGLFLVPGADEVWFGQHSDRPVTLGIDLPILFIFTFSDCGAKQEVLATQRVLFVYQLCVVAPVCVRVLSFLILQRIIELCRVRVSFFFFFFHCFLLFRNVRNPEMRSALADTPVVCGTQVQFTRPRAEKEGKSVCEMNRGACVSACVSARRV